MSAMKGFVWQNSEDYKFLSLRGNLRNPNWEGVEIDFTFDVNKATVLDRMNPNFRCSKGDRELLDSLVPIKCEMYVVRIVRLLE
jgi:hypothetical protein